MIERNFISSNIVGRHPWCHNLNPRRKCDIIFYSQACEGWDSRVVPQKKKSAELEIRVRYKNEPGKSIFRVTERVKKSLVNVAQNSATTSSFFPP